MQMSLVVFAALFGDNYIRKWCFFASKDSWFTASFNFESWKITANSGVAAGSVRCPTDYFNYYGDLCYKFVTSTATWDMSRAICQQDGGDLASIHSYDENFALGQAMPDNTAEGRMYDYYWIGLRCHEDVQEKYWTDGTPVDYEIYYERQCSNDKGWVMLTLPYNNEWYDEQLTGEANVVCKVDPLASHTTTKPTGAPAIAGSECGNNYELVEVADACVRIGKERLSWNDAEGNCVKEGAHLVSVHSQQANDVLRRLAVANRLTNALHIGIQLDDNKDLGWSDGSAIDYSNYDIGMPNKLFGQCTMMDARTVEAKWASIYCDDINRLPYICAKPKPCPANNTYTVQGDVYSPEYPSSPTSGLNCEYYVAAAEGEHVMLKIEEFQLVDGDYLLLYEGLSSDTPLAVITSVKPDDRFSTTAENVMRIVHQTGNGRGIRKWHVSFAGF